jgi:hypothetical protein
MGAFAACAGGGGLPDVAIDFSNPSAADSAESSAVDSITSNVINPSKDLLPRYAGYQDCQQLIAGAISNASPANVDAAWAAAVPNVRFQAELFDFAASVINAFQSLTSYVRGLPGGRAIDHYQQHPLATKTFAQLFDIIIQFDETTSRLPKLLGDLSFFRRTASRRPDFQDYDDLYQKSSEMSMFFAVPSPLLSKATGAISNIAKSPQDVAQVLDVFGGLSDVLTSVQINHPSASQDDNLMCYRAIAACILCFDTISGQGAFHAKAGVKTLSAVEVLAAADPKQTGLLNLLKFNSKHFKDPTTLKQISALIP